MSKNSKHTGFAIAIAWPQTYCKQPGYWYDTPANYLGYSHHHYYQVGHAALVLVHADQPHQCHYSDFGRYHAPFQHGRVRNAATDPELQLHTRLQLNPERTEILNFETLLRELQLNPAYHGEGPIHASYAPINFQKSIDKVQQLQARGPIPYGPFRYNGSNCSRFVNTAILAGQPNLKQRLKLQLFVPLTPTPLNNVHALNHIHVMPRLQTTPLFSPKPIQNKNLLTQTLPEPNRPTALPTSAQWLSGEGAGSWFHLQYQTNSYYITRYNDRGQIEFANYYQPSAPITPSHAYQFIHPSHYQHIHIRQHEQTIRFTLSPQVDP